MNSIQKTARLAGFYYLLVAIFGFYGIMYVPSQVMEKGDAIATMQQILEKELNPTFSSLPPHTKPHP
jgi:hypothetical protein